MTLTRRQLLKIGGLGAASTVFAQEGSVAPAPPESSGAALDCSTCARWVTTHSRSAA